MGRPTASDLNWTPGGTVPNLLVVQLSRDGKLDLYVTATDPTANPSSFLTLWPTGASRPLASDLNFVTGLTVANLVIVKIGANGQVDVYNAAGNTQVVVDVMGWYQ